MTFFQALYLLETTEAITTATEEAYDAVYEAYSLGEHSNRTFQMNMALERYEELLEDASMKELYEKMISQDIS